MIKVLSEQLASQIAAGEVVERPASVAKELLENAIDAGATLIFLDVREGGRALVQVADNGSGIASAEVETAFLRHATSKLDSAESLASISTLGFRGEALAAIASVSELTIVTRTPNDTAGTRLELSGGHVRTRDRVGAPQGTVIGVEKLFFNTPARLNFLKSAVSERRAIDDLIIRYAMAYPHIRFRLSHDGRVTLQTAGNGSLLDAIVSVYGVEIGRELIPLPEPTSTESAENNEIIVRGYLSAPALHRSNRNHITFFVNGRWVQDTKLNYAVIEAYHTLLPTGRYPLAVLFIEMPFTEVDVNVHPAKAEVRFRRPSAVFMAVQKIAREAIMETGPVRTIPSPFEQLTTPPEFGRQRDLPLNSAEPMPPVRSGADFEPHSAPSMPLGGEKLPIMRVVGQISTSFIITEGPQGMYLIDQHAAHERILYEQFLAAFHKKAVASQPLVAGSVVELTLTQATLIETHLSALEKLGFQIELFGVDSVIVRAVPAILAKFNPVQAIREIASELESDRAPLQAKIEEMVLRRVCKSAAIKAGQVLSFPEMEALMRQLEACESPHTCPHGRPTLIYLSVVQLARQFGRS